MASDVVERLNPILRVLLLGVHDEGSSLSLLRGVPEVVKNIWNEVTSYWKSYIKQDLLSYTKVKQDVIYRWYDDDKLNWEVEFPKPTGININMMPFIMERSFDKCKLPENLKDYFEYVIKRCLRIESYETSGKWQIGKIGFLTIQESLVDDDDSQIRAGLHTESPGVAYVSSSWGEKELTVPYLLHLYGGIYMGSTVDNSCEVWNCKVLPVKNGAQVVGDLGDCEHLREFLPKGEIMKKNVIYWLTDRTPYESLPLKKGTFRQLFRQVSSDVSVWYEEHSTKNPLGVVPDPEITKIVKSSTFDKDGEVIVNESDVETNPKKCFFM